MSDQRIEVADRYRALGMPYPNPETMCRGQCGGIGCYPQNIHDPDITTEGRMAWEFEGTQATPECRAEAERDGYHFIVCPTCRGTGKRPATMDQDEGGPNPSQLNVRDANYGEGSET